MAPKKIVGGGRESSTILEKISNSEVVSQGRRAACDAVYVAKKLLKSTGKAAWIVGVTAIILVVPLVIDLGRDQEISEYELEQETLLGTPQPYPQASL